MKKILILTYYWPPSGGAAVQRWLSFANQLAEENYSVHVITVDEKQATYQLRDESLVNHVHPAINVHTTRTREPFKAFTFLFGKKSMPKPAFSNENNPSFVKKVSRFIRGNYFIPDPRKGWKPFAIKKATALIQQEGIKCVITAGPPHSTHFIGKKLKEKLNVYWIADFHDLWTDVIYYDMLYHLPFVKKWDKRLERTILESADHLITVGDKYRQRLLSKSENIADEKIDILRIGYDEKLMGTRTVGELQKEFIITYTGTIADFYQPEVFIQALKAVVAKFPNVPFRLRFAGVLSDDIKTKITDVGLAPLLEDLGYLSHQQALQLMKSSTVLLLVNPVTTQEEMVIPGKIYEYLAAGKPIINISKTSAETATIISACNTGRTFNRNEKAALEDYLTELVTTWQSNKTLDIKNNSQLVQQYSRQEITHQLMALIEGRV